MIVSVMATERSEVKPMLTFSWRSNETTYMRVSWARVLDGLEHIVQTHLGRRRAHDDDEDYEDDPRAHHHGCGRMSPHSEGAR